MQEAISRRVPKNRAHVRQLTTAPVVTPPILICPDCEDTLTYRHSYIGGVNANQQEQWDYFWCGCGSEYQYRHRTRRLTRQA